MEKIEKEKSKIETIDKLFAKKKPIRKSAGKKQEEGRMKHAIEPATEAIAQEKPAVEVERISFSRKGSQGAENKKNQDRSVGVAIKTGKKKVVAGIKKTASKRIARPAKSEKMDEMEWVDNADPASYKRMKAKKSKRFVWMGIVGICVVCAAIAYFFYTKHIRAGSGREDGAAQMLDNAGQDDVQMIRSAVERLVELPIGEDPVIATVTDADKIKAQKFFNSAQNGDRVLIYKENKKVVLYRPTINKIIEFSSTSEMDDQAQVVDTTPVAQTAGGDAKQAAEDGVLAVESPAKVAIYNGSKIKGLAKKIGETISSMPEVSVVQAINANGDYGKTLIIDVSGSHPELAKKIAESLGGEIGNLPDGETKPEADILIIGGSGSNLDL
ncbi:MAG: LytR C-terminal domain-containing protein [Candidatus Moranbacteria bacterium]|nr:LytR C-terminal domain-containing protein [bacterium]MDP1833743.1 LytR C-terminal domain-containing protein [Candidatus Moranbacteria bacterium]